MKSEKKYTYGPVPSRRLGFSLGIDIIPFKHCTFDCVYCQLGRTTFKTDQRSEYTPADEIIEEIKKTLATKDRIEYLTFSGSGEPTLHSRLGYIISSIKEFSNTPVAVLTNGSLTSLVHVVQFNVFDRLLGLSPMPWNRTFRQIARRKAAAAKQALKTDRERRTYPPLPLTAYAGEYYHPGYGRLSVSTSGKRLHLHYNGIPFQVRHDRDNVFEISGRHEDPVVAKASFQMSSAEEIEAVAIPFEAMATGIVFSRLTHESRCRS